MIRRISRRLLFFACLAALASLGCLPGASANASREAVSDDAVASSAAVKTPASSQPAVSLKKSNGKYYVNNHEISLNFNYDSEFYDRTAWFKSHFNIHSTSATSIISAELGDFDTNWGYSKSKNQVLAVKVNNLNGHVSRRCGGVYNDVNDSYPVYNTTMMVDPDTGRVFDFLEGNYFYKWGYMRYHFLNSQPVTCAGC